MRALADENGAGRGDRLETGGRVHEIPGNHALVRGADRHGGFAGQHAGTRLDPLAQGPDRDHEVQCGPNGALRVVLVGRGRAPDGHHRVADELLDGATVPCDHVRRDLEVEAQGLADVLGVPLLGKRGEAHEIGEQDGDEAALGGGWDDGGARGRRCHLGRGRRGTRGGRSCRQGRRTLAAELRRGRVGRSAARADRGKRRTAFDAELPPRVVGRAAVRAVHGVPTSTAAA